MNSSTKEIIFFIAGGLVAAFGYVFRNILLDIIRKFLNRKKLRKETIDEILQEVETIVTIDSDEYGFDLTNTYLSDRELTKAFNTLKRAQALDSNDVDVLLCEALLLACWKKAEKISEIIKSVRTKLKTRNQFLSAGMAASDCDPNISISIFEEGLNKYADDSLILFNLGTALAKTLETDRAILCIEQAMELDPMFKYRGRINKAIIYRSEGDYDRALAELDIAKDINPTDHKAFQEIVRTLMEKNELEAAKSHISVLCERFPDKPSNFELLADLCEKQNSPTELTEALRRLISLSPENIAANIRMGKALLGSGNIESSWLSFQRAIHLSQGDLSVTLKVAKFLAEYKEISKYFLLLHRAHEESSDENTKKELEKLIEGLKQSVISRTLESFAPKLAKKNYKDIEINLGPMTLMKLMINPELEHLLEPMTNLMNEADSMFPDNFDSKMQYLARAIFYNAIGYPTEVQCINMDQARELLKFLEDQLEE